MADGAKPMRSAFRSFYEENFPVVWKQLRRLQVRDADIPDLAHDVLYVAYRRFEEVPASPRGWLARVCFEMVRNYRKKAGRRLETLEADVGEAVPSRSEAEDVIREVVLEALDRMPEEQRTLLLRHHLGDETLAALAKDFGVARSTMQVRIAAAEETFERWLRKLLDERDDITKPVTFLSLTFAALLVCTDEPSALVTDAASSVWAKLSEKIPGPKDGATRTPWLWTRPLSLPAKLAIGVAVAPAVCAGMLLGYLGRDVAEANAPTSAKVSIGATVAMSVAPFVAQSGSPVLPSVSPNTPSSDTPEEVLGESSSGKEGASPGSKAPAARQAEPQGKPEEEDADPRDLALVREARREIVGKHYDEALRLLNQHALLFRKSTHGAERDKLIGVAMFNLADQANKTGKKGSEGK